MDAVFWNYTSRTNEAGAFDKAILADIAQQLETGRLSFLNEARREIIGVSVDLERLPIARPATSKYRLYPVEDNEPN
jgi:hypothetical protein